MSEVLSCKSINNQMQSYFYSRAFVQVVDSNAEILLVKSKEQGANLFYSVAFIATLINSIPFVRFISTLIGRLPSSNSLEFKKFFAKKGSVF